MNRNKQIKPIRSHDEHRKALDELYPLLDAPDGSDEYDRAELLSILIENYEEKHFPIEDPDPIEAIKYLMEENEMNQSELGEIIGGKSKASLILNRKRALSISMIRSLNKRLKIPLEILMKEYPLMIYIPYIATVLVAFF
jgi:HTH-type transcriptional regulator/antitoxin HigA